MSGFLGSAIGGEERGPRRPIRLRARLVLLGTVVTLAAIASAFALLSLEIRRQSRSHLADLLLQSEKTVLEMQKRNLEEVLRTSRLMTESPTLRAAMETYESEGAGRAGGRTDLLSTVRTELDRVRSLLGKDLAIITGAQGSVLAASPAPGPAASAAEWEKGFASHPCVRAALSPGPSTRDANPSVLDLAGERYRIGCVPIVLQDYVIGTLTVGERIDRASLEALRGTLGSEVVVTRGEDVLASTIGPPAPGAPAEAARLPFRAPTGGAFGGAAPDVVEVGGEEYVVASLPLGPDGTGLPVTLTLLKSLSRARASAARSLLLALLACGAFAILLGTTAAWRVSHMVLDPLERFVGFMHEVAEGKDPARHFEGAGEDAEIQVLAQAYNVMVDSLEEQKKRLLVHAREELARVDRLRESEKLASLGRMLSGAAHEINNPLTGVIGNLDVLLRAPQMDEATRQRLERVHKEAQRIVSLVKNLLKVARRDTGERDLVEVNAIVEEALDLRRHDFTTAGLALRFEPWPAPLSLHGSALELQQVFLNILGNAYDALREGAGDPSLRVRTALENDRIVVIFEDGGPGLKDARKVFDPFYTTKEIGKGTGLGLSISHAIVQSHGGQIAAENRAGGGARFTISLPARKGAEPAGRPAEPRREVRSPAPRLSVAALVMEDEPTILELQLGVLGSLGATAVGAPTGAEAIAALERRPFDVVLLDLKMPGALSGQDLYHWIERHRPALVPRVIFVTGDSANDRTRAFLAATGRRCLMKPFSVEEYVTAIQETLGALRPAA